MSLFGPPNVEKMKARRNIFGLTMALFYQKDRQVRTDAARALGDLKDVRAVHALIDAIIAAHKNRDFTDKREVGEALEKIGTPAVEKLIDALKKRRAPVVEVLGNIGDARAVEPLIAALKNGSAPAAEALGKIGDIRAVEPLIAALKNGSADVRKTAAGALGKLKDIRTVEPLIAALRNSESMVRQAAAQALGDLNDACVVEPLIAALKDPNQAARSAAAEALGRIGDLRAVEPLISAVKTDVQDSATKALAGMYRGGKLDDRSKSLILSLQSKLRRPHEDYISTGGNCPDHTDIPSFELIL